MKSIYEHKMKRMELEFSKKIKQIEDAKQQVERDLNQKILLLENDKEHLETFKEMYDNLAITCANKDTHVTNNHSKNTYNQVLQILETAGPLDLSQERLKSICDTEYTTHYFRRGIAGLADFTAKHIITNEGGEKAYAVSDRSRHHYKYMLGDGSIQSDSKAENVLDAIHGPVMNKINNNIWVRNTPVPEDSLDFDFDMEKHASMNEAYDTINTIKDHQSKFCNYLSNKL